MKIKIDIGECRRLSLVSDQIAPHRQGTVQRKTATQAALLNSGRSIARKSMFSSVSDQIVLHRERTMQRKTATQAALLNSGRSIARKSIFSRFHGSSRQFFKRRCSSGVSSFITMMDGIPIFNVRMKASDVHFSKDSAPEKRAFCRSRGYFVRSSQSMSSKTANDAV